MKEKLSPIQEALEEIEAREQAAWEAREPEVAAVGRAWAARVAQEVKAWEDTFAAALETIETENRP